MNANAKPALIWGAGAIGSILGASLIEAGRQVVFVDLNRQHIGKIRDGGLLITGAAQEKRFHAPAFIPQEIEGTFDIAFLCVRLNDNADAIPALARHLAPGATVVSCQNGFGALDVAQAFGPERTVAASFFLPAEFRAPGHVVYGSKADIALGMPGGDRGAALDHACAVLSSIDADVHAVEDIDAVIWTKLCYGALLAAAALDDGLIAGFMAAPRYRPIVLDIVREMVTIAERSGHPAKDLAWFEPNRIGSPDTAVSERSLDITLARLRKSAKPVSGYWTQIVKHGRRSELGLMFTPVLRMAQEAGCNPKVLPTLMALIDDMESGRAVNGSPLLDRLLASAGKTSA